MIVVSVEAHAFSLRGAGLGEDDIASWAAAQVAQTADFETDRARYSRFFHHCDDLLQRLPSKPRRNDAEAAAAAALFASAREHRERFLAAHAEALYDRLTRNRSLFLRLDALVMEAASAVPGLTPTREQLTRGNEQAAARQGRLEIDQGIFLAHVLASERAGTHLCHAMLLPRPASGGAVAAACRRRPCRSRHRDGRAPRQGGSCDHGEPAFSQRRGRDDARRSRSSRSISPFSIQRPILR